jgi:hypothetical protein
MLYRLEKQGRIAITLSTHAWLSGQLARASGETNALVKRYHGRRSVWEQNNMT